MPAVHADTPPPENLQSWFTWKPASEWDEHWVALDLEDARQVANSFLDGFAALRFAALDVVP